METFLDVCIVFGVFSAAWHGYMAYRELEPLRWHFAEVERTRQRRQGRVAIAS